MSNHRKLKIQENRKQKHKKNIVKQGHPGESTDYIDRTETKTCDYY